MVSLTRENDAFHIARIENSFHGEPTAGQEAGDDRENDDEAGRADRAVCGHAARRCRGLGALGEFRGARDRLLAAHRPAPTRRYAGTSHIDVANLGAAEGKDITAGLAAKGIEISALGYYPNPLHPDASHREKCEPHKAGDQRRGKMGVVAGQHLLRRRCERRRSTTTGPRPRRSGPSSSPTPRTRACKLAFENCPMIFSHDEWPGGHNIAYSPKHLAPHPRDLGWRGRHELRSVASGLADDRPGPLHPRIRPAYASTSTPRI